MLRRAGGVCGMSFTSPLAGRSAAKPPGGAVRIGNAPPHLWGGGPKGRRGVWHELHPPLAGEVAREAAGWGSPNQQCSSPFMGRWPEGPEGLVVFRPLRRFHAFLGRPVPR